MKVPFYLYVPPTSVDAARRLCAEHQIPVAEVWTFHMTFDQVRFTMIYRSPDAPKVRRAGPEAGGRQGEAGRQAEARRQAESAAKPAANKAGP